MKPKSSQLPIAFYLAALMGLVFFDVTAGGCGIVGRHKTLDSDLLRDDAMQIFAEFGSANKRLPTTTEYVETYRKLLAEGKIGDPLPNDSIWADLQKHGLLSKTSTMKGYVGTKAPFLNSISQPANGTQFQLGAVAWQAWRHGSRIAIKVWNDITPNSLWLHMGLPEWSSDHLHSM